MIQNDVEALQERDVSLPERERVVFAVFHVQDADGRAQAAANLVGGDVIGEGLLEQEHRTASWRDHPAYALLLRPDQPPRPPPEQVSEGAAHGGLTSTFWLDIVIGQAAVDTDHFDVLVREVQRRVDHARPAAGAV